MSLRRAVAGALVVLLLVVVASLLLGVRAIPVAEVVRAVVTPDVEDPSHAVVRDLRFPRTVIGLVAGAALGLAGTLIQGITRNPIADPGILGINAGASLAVVSAIAVLGVATPGEYVWFAFAGAAGAAALVAAVGGGRDPVRLVLSGAAVTALFVPALTLVLLRSDTALDQFRFWAVGSLVGRDLGMVADVWPFVAVGGLVALGMGSRLDVLALGDDVARSLGQSVGRTRALGAVAIVLLSGTATSLVGPIALVGLVVPHAGRHLVGPDHRGLLVLSVLLGPTMLLAADVVGRLLVRPGEVEAGVVAAFLGAPVLVRVARGRGVVTA